MDVDAFLVWAEGREGRWELRDGQPVLMAPERAAHALTKFAAQKALEAAIARAGLPCRMFPDGMTVRITARTAFEPDALVVCPSPPIDTMEIPNPGHRGRGPVAEHGGGRSRGQARRLFLAAERRALSDSRPRPAGDDPPQARRPGRSKPASCARASSGSIRRASRPRSRRSSRSEDGKAQMQRPPSTSSTTPVRNEASSLAR